jgi:cytochrome c-type biogenesis protein CcmH
VGEQARKWVAGVITVALAVVVLVGLIIGEDSDQDRVRALGTRIKCPVCQGESIADSPSETATAMLDIVEERVAEGQSDGQIIDYFVSRYGDGILLDPPFAGRTLLLWLLPLFAVGGGVWMILGRRRSGDSEPAEEALL